MQFLVCLMCPRLGDVTLLFHSTHPEVFFGVQMTCPVHEWADWNSWVFLFPLDFTYSVKMLEEPKILQDCALCLQEPPTPTPLRCRDLEADCNFETSSLNHTKSLGFSNNRPVAFDWPSQTSIQIYHSRHGAKVPEPPVWWPNLS